MKKILYLLLMTALLVAGVAYAADGDFWAVKDITGTDVLRVDSNGDILPGTDSTYDIGASGSEFAEGHFDSLYLGGVAKTSWGSVVSPMTDYTGYVAPTDAGSKLKLHDDGDLTLGGAVATDVQITWDGNAQDFYVGLDDSADQLQIGYGSTLGTTNLISLGAARVLYVGDNTTNDFAMVFQNGDQDFHIGIDDTGGIEEDLFVIGRGAAAGTTDDLAIGKASGTVYVNALDAPGNVDFDIGSADVDDVTVITDGGTLILDGTITLTDSEVISNATDDTVRIASNDAATIVEVYTPGTANEDASVRLTADAGADAGDIMQIQHDGATNSLLIQSDTAAKGTPATILTIAKTGVVTSTSYIDNYITDTNDNAVVDVVRFSHNGSTPAAGIGAGAVYYVDDGGGMEEQASIDAVMTDVTDSAEFADIVFSQNTNGTVRETLRLNAGVGSTSADTIEYTANTAETDGIVDIAVLTLDSTGTGGANLGAGISVKLDDAGGVEEQASIDFQLNTATNGAEDCDIVFSQNTAGAIAETLKLVAASSATTCDYLKYTSNTTETDAVTNVLVLTQATGTATTGNGLGISFQPEDAGGAEEQASLDVALTTATDSSEMADIIFSQNTAGAIAETLRLVAASSATTSDYLQYTANTTETNGVTDILILKTATGTAADNYGIGISFQPEDGTGSEEVASIDIVETTAARATNDTDIVFSQNVNGTITERVRFDADGSNIVLSGTTPSMTIGDAGDEDIQVNFNQDTQDYSCGVDATDDSFQICAGTALGTTPAISVATTQVVSFAQTVVFSGGQTRQLVLDPATIDLDDATPPAKATITGGTGNTWEALQFDADGGATGDDIVYFKWKVPSGYVADSGRLKVQWSCESAETATDAAVFDLQYLPIAPGEVVDAAATDISAVSDATWAGTADVLMETSVNFETTAIAVGDIVYFKFWVDEDASAFTDTVDIHAFVIEWESTE